MAHTTSPARPSPRRAAPVPPVAHVPQAGREGLVASVLVGLGVVVVGFWWRDTPPGSLHGLAAELTAAGRLTGLVGAYLVLVEVLLLARVRWLDRLIGMDRLAVWHRRNGQYLLTLLVAHAGFITLGYRLTGRGATAGPRPVASDIGPAVIGLALLVGVGILSARAIRQRVGYQLWYGVHLTTYLAIVAALPHQFSSGDDFVNHPLNRAFWIALYGGVVFLVLSQRVVLPVRNALRHRLRVAAVVPEGPGVVSIYVTGRRLDDLRAEAGQFFKWRFLSRRGWWETHPFSLSAAPNPDWLRLTVKALGNHTERLTALRPGTRVFAQGPYGAFTRLRRTRRRVLLIGAGIGIAPLRALFETLPAGPGHLTLLYRASRPEDLVFRAELDELARRRAAVVHYLVGPRDAGPDPLSAEALRQGVPHLADHDVYLCGPPALVADVAAALRAAGVPCRRIHQEGFAL
jgi:predicted ferric reductase